MLQPVPSADSKRPPKHARGAVVRGLSPEEVRQIYAVREELGKMMAARALRVYSRQ
jgi:DNA-binding GntR family transcriptional regulator